MADRNWLYALRDNLIGYDDGVTTPGERLGQGVNHLATSLYNDPGGTVMNALTGVKGDLDDLMFHGGAERRPGDVFNYAAGSMAPGALARAPAGALRSGPARNEGIRAYHGSPHEFDRFSMDKIGTGEGAQAYGHGLYFAENEAVARGYRDILSAQIPDGLEDAGLPFEVHDTVRWYRNRGHGPDEIMKDIRQNFPEHAEAVEKALNVPKGSMYEVRINADPDSFLDWDAPLSEQPPSVQQLAQREGISEAAPEWRFNGFDGGYFRRTETGSKKIGEVRHLGGDQYRAKVGRDELGVFSSPENARAAIDKALEQRGGAETALQMRGADIYDRLSGGIDSISHETPRRAEATQAFLGSGVPGIKYRDAGSRGLDGQEGTRNYVVFDENLIEIVRKYGIAGAATMLGVSASEVEAAMQGGQQGQPTTRNALAQ